MMSGEGALDTLGELREDELYIKKDTVQHQGGTPQRQEAQPQLTTQDFFDDHSTHFIRRW